VTFGGKKAHTFCMEYFWSQRDHLKATSLLFSNSGSNFNQAFETQAESQGAPGNDESG
jgi:hypothetical protein